MRKKRTTEEFIILANEKHINKYDYSLVEYLGDKIKVKIICPYHGVFEQRPTNHLSSNQGCPKCNKKKCFTNLEFIDKAKKIHGDKYDYSLVEYFDSKTKVKIICSTHGEFEQSPKSHLNLDGCVNCRKPNILEFIDKAKKIHGDKYDYSLVEYFDSKTKVKIICSTHGEFEQKINDHLYGNGCPICKESKGERGVRIYLNDNNINYKPQHRFSDCRDKNPLPFDFYLPEYNTCIEFNGKQHYTYLKFFHKSKYYYKKQVKRDNIKKEYCANNNINLIVVKENENIEKVLTEKLNKYE